MTTSEENYIKVIYHLSLVSPKGVNTNAIAGMLDTKASSVTDMLKKLSEKASVPYVQGYAPNNPKPHSHLCKRYHEYHRP